MPKVKTKKETTRVKPSELPKDKQLSKRYSSLVEELLIEKGYSSLNDFIDKAIDKELGKVEFEKRVSIVQKKPNK